MSINERMKDLRFEYGKEHIQQKELADALGLPASTISDYEKDGYYVPHEAIIKYCDYFNVSADYLLGRTEIRNQPHQEIHELHLSEKAMEKLKNNKINPHILSDIIEHEQFDGLLMDADIYVRGYLDEGIQKYNCLMETARESLINMDKGSYDKELMKKQLEHIHISQDAYFAHDLHERLRIILKDIKELHKDDADTSDFSYDAFKEEIISFAALPKEGSIGDENLTRALSSSLMLILKIKKTPQSTELVNKFVSSLKIDNASAQELSSISALIEPDARKRRRNNAKLGKK